MFKPMKVKALQGYRLWLEYADGVEGEVDLSHLAGQGVFSAWKEPGIFETVHIGEGGSVAWSNDVDLCPDALYLEITQKTPEDVFPNLKTSKADA